MFESTKEDLKDILRKVDEARLQLPDFQRDYVWGDDDVQSLIASIAKGFPVGALLTLEAGGAVAFKPRPLAGVAATDREPEELLLDGQQRMTSLYQSMYCRAPIRTRTQKKVVVERYYYLDINKASSDAADIEEAIVGVPADRIVRTNFGRDIVRDLSAPEHEYEQDMFPLNQILDHTDWYFGWRRYWNDREVNRFDLETRFFKGVVENIQRYKMPIIRLDRKNSREAICLVFEKVNVGGKKLDAFELVTAIYAAGSFDLREDWSGPPGQPGGGRSGRMIGRDNPRRILKRIERTDFLQACTLLHTRERRLERAAAGVPESDLPQVTCKRDALLGLPLASYRRHADTIERGFVEAADFLSDLKVIAPRDLPYPAQLVTLAATLAIVGRDGQTAPAREKLSRWFWSIAFGEQYGSATESKMARDVQDLCEWLGADGPRPRSVEEAILQRDRLLRLRSRNSAAYKAIHALLMRKGCRDFISGKPFELMSFWKDKIDVHHIFPQKWCKRADISPRTFDSIVNKTPLSRSSNLAVSGDAPSLYLARIEKKHGLSPDQLDDILRTHLIEPGFLRADDFEGFFASRLKALADMISSVLDNPVVESHGHDEPETPIDDDDDEDAEAADDPSPVD